MRQSTFQSHFAWDVHLVAQPVGTTDTSDTSDTNDTNDTSVASATSATSATNLMGNALGNMDLHSLPGIVHVAFEVPEWSHVLRLCLLRCIPRSYDHLAVARGKDYCHLPKAPGIRISALDDVRCRPGLSPIDREFDPLNGSSFAGYCIALDTRWSCRYYLAFSRRRDHSVECQIFYALCPTPIGCLRGNRWREELILDNRVQAGRHVLLKREFAQPLDAPGADIARHDDTQMKPIV